MEQQKVDMYLMSNQKFFPMEKTMYLREKLLAMDDSKYSMLLSMELQNPSTLFLVSLFAGGLGIDRFMLGDTGMGVLKLLTGGCCGILTLVDWFTVQDKAKEQNFNKVMQLL